MVAFNITKHIEAPTDEVFRRAISFENAHEVMSGIESVEMLTDGPVGVGTRFKETRIMFNRPCTEEMEVTEFEAGRRYVLGCENHGCLYRSEIKVEPSASGSDISLQFEAIPQTRMAKIMSFLTRPMAKMVVKHCAKDLDDLKAAIESAAEQRSAATGGS